MPNASDPRQQWGDDYFEPAPVRRTVRVRGRVFLDRNRDGALSGRDTPLGGVIVCDEDRIVRTREDGTFAFSFHVEEHRCVWMQQPSGYKATTPWYRLIRQDDTETEYYFEFGLAPYAASNPGRDFRFVVVADSQFGTKEAGHLLKDDMAEVAATVQPPEFVVNCGDIVMTGWLREWKMYMHAMKRLHCPLYHCVGGHEMNYGRETPMGRRSDHHYRLFVGPTHFSWDFAGVHFVSYDSWQAGASKATLQRQERWVRADLRNVRPGANIVIVTHYPIDVSRWMRKGRVRAIFYGHWHENLLYTHRGVPYMQTVSLRGGDFGMFARAMRVCEFRAGELLTEIRPFGQRKRLQLTSVAAKPGKKDVMVSALAYNTSSEVKKVMLRDEKRRKVRLKKVGCWTWRGCLPASPQATKEVTLVATDNAGASWEARGRIPRASGPCPRVRVNEDWPWFGRNCEAGRWTSLSLKPPLRPAWRINTGSRNQLANSPMLYRRKLYVGTHLCDVTREPPVLVCISPNTGRRLWRCVLDGDVLHSPAAFDGKVFVVTNRGTTYAVDADSGDVVWSRNMWGKYSTFDYHKLPAPVVPYDGNVIVACEYGPVVMYDGKTGRALFRHEDPTPSKRYLYFSGPFAHKGVLYWANRYHTLAQDIASGRTLWETDTRKLGTRGVAMGVVSHGVFYQNSAASLMAFDAKSGKLLWHQPTRSGCWAVASPVVGERCVIGGGAERVCLARDTGRRVWTFETRLGKRQAAQNRHHKLAGQSTPCVAGDVIYFGGEDGVLYALDVKTGRLLWRYDPGLPIKCSPITSGNALFVSDYDGNLYAFVSGR